MPDRERVIKGLETIKQFFEYGLPSTAEMFDSYYGTLNDAIAQLKEQESVIPIERNQFYYCSACHYALMSRNQNYCSNCGKPVKWDD